MPKPYPKEFTNDLLARRILVGQFASEHRIRWLGLALRGRGVS